MLINMMVNKKKLIILPVLLITLMLLSTFTKVNASIYTPYTWDKFSYAGTQTESQIQSNFRIITNTSTGVLIDYYN